MAVVRVGGARVCLALLPPVHLTACIPLPTISLLLKLAAAVLSPALKRMPPFGSFRRTGVTSFSGMGSLGGSGMLTPPITPAGAARGLSKTRLFVVVHKVSN